MIAAYLLCAVSGFAFMAISALAGHFGGHAHAGHGGHAGHAGHGGAHAHSGSLELPLFSPTAIAAYLTGFGSAGLVITQGLGVTNPLIHVPASAVTAFAFGAGVVFSIAKLTQKAEGNSLASLNDVVGTEVEVTVSIPVGGVGEVAYVDAGTRQTAMARADAGQTFSQGSKVKVTRALDGTLYVTTLGALHASSGATVGEPVESPPREKEKVR